MKKAAKGCIALLLQVYLCRYVLCTGIHVTCSTYQEKLVFLFKSCFRKREASYNMFSLFLTNLAAIITLHTPKFNHLLQVLFA